MWYGFSFLLGILGTAGFILWIARSFAEKERIRNERDALEANLEAIHDAKDIKNRVDNDPSFRDRVRDKYR